MPLHTAPSEHTVALLAGISASSGAGAGGVPDAFRHFSPAFKSAARGGAGGLTPRDARGARAAQAAARV